MAVLAYKPKQGDIWALFGEGKFVISQGVYKVLGDKHYLFCLLDKQNLIGKDSSQKDGNGKAATVELVYPLKARLELDKETSHGKALVALFEKISPELADGFEGEIDYSLNRSAMRIGKEDVSNRDYDLKGGLCDLSKVEITTDWDLSALQAGNKWGQKSYKSTTEIAVERAQIAIQMIAQLDTPIGMSYLKTIEYYEQLELPIPTPLQFLEFLCGK